MADEFSHRRARAPMERAESALILSTLLLLVVLTVQPLLNLLALSLSDPSKVAGFSGLSIIPDGFSPNVWLLLLQHPYVQRGIFNSVWMTAASVLIGTFGTALMAWPLSR
ncbi:MAG: carbohydrate ABC transporter permease, partial [Devosia sp.]